MHINLAGHHVEITAALKAYVEEKLERIERHFDNVVNVHVVLSVAKQGAKAEGTLHVAGADLHAEAENDDMYAAIDAMTDKLDRQVRRFKEKLTDHHKREVGRAQ